MKDIFTILTEAKVEITDEQKASIKKELNDNYKTIAEFNKKVDEIKAKEKTIEEKDASIKSFEEKVEKLEADNKGIEDLKTEIANYKADEEKRKEKAERDKKIAGYKARFNPLKADKEFFNSYVENGVFDEFCKALEDDANVGKSDKEVYEAITKDKDIYKNPNTKIDLPNGNGGGGDKETDAIDKARAIMGLKPKTKE